MNNTGHANPARLDDLLADHATQYLSDAERAGVINSKLAKSKRAKEAATA